MAFMNRGIRFSPLLLIFAAVSAAHASDVARFTDAHGTLGKKSAVAYDMGAIVPAADPSETDEDSAGFYAVLNAMLLGKNRSILETQASVTNTLEGESDFYWGGFRVWSSKPEWKDGAFRVSAGLPTVSMRSPVAAFPVGPLTIRLDVGVAAEAEIEASLTPLISIPVQFTSVQATLTPKVSAAGFIEGYAKFIAVRGGVGGFIELIRANASIDGNVSLGGVPPVFTFDGFVSLLSGRIYAFVDYFNVFKWKWRRALEPTLADWKGKCIDLSKASGTKEGDPCAIAP
jgi:hypothetical protein